MTEAEYDQTVSLATEAEAQRFTDIAKDPAIHEKTREFVKQAATPGQSIYRVDAAGDGSLVFRFMGSLASTIDPGVHYTSTSESDNFQSTESPGDNREREPEKLIEGSIVAVPGAGSGNPYSNA